MDPVNLTFTAHTLCECFEAGDPACGAKDVERRHVELIDRAYEAIGKGDAEAVLGMLAPDATLTIDGFLDMDGHWEGAENVLAAAGRNFAKVEAQQVSIEQVCAQGDQVAILFRELGHYRPTGEAYDARAVQWFRIADGRIAGIRQIAHVTTSPAERVLA